MLDIRFILSNKDIVKDSIKNRRLKEVDLDLLQKLYEKRQQIIKERDELNHMKKIAAENRDVESGKKIKEKSSSVEEEYRKLTKEVQDLLSKIPNIPMPDVPIGADEDDNVIIKSYGEKRDFSFKPKPHWELGEELDIIDNVRAAKVAGARFTFLKGDLVKLQFAIIKFVFDVVTNEEVLKQIINKNDFNISSKPFIPVIPPVMINPASYYGVARLEPKEDKFYINADDLYLVGSAEHTLGSMHSKETFNEKDLPLRYIGYSTAFRREAGSYGKDTKGILRQHQFDKLELESFTSPENSKIEQDFFVAIQEYLMQQLNLHYHVISVCTGDMGTPDMRQIDIETWMPGQDKYRETHSADLMGEYQTRRLATKIKRTNGETEFAHTNDATAFAIGRLLIAIIENYQQEDGSIKVPEVLQKYAGIDVIKK